MPRIMQPEKHDVRIRFSSFWNFLQIQPESLGPGESHYSFAWVELISETVHGHVLQQLLHVWRRRCIEAREKLPPKDRQETIGAKTRGQQQPKTSYGRQLPAKPFDSCQPRSRQSRRAPRFGCDNGVARVNNVHR